MFGHPMKKKGSNVMDNQIIIDAINEFGKDKVKVVNFNPIFNEYYDTKLTSYGDTGLIIKRKYDRDIIIRRKAIKRPKGSYNNVSKDPLGLISKDKSKKRLKDVILSNVFQWWGYVSFDPKKHPWCFDLSEVDKQVTRLLKTFKAKHDNDFAYVVVYEATKKGQIHAHLLLKFTDPNKWFEPVFKKNGKPLLKRKYFQQINNWKYWQDGRYRDFGFSNFINIENKYLDYINNFTELHKIANYISKYLTKDNLPNKKRYKISQALQRPSTALCNSVPPTAHSYTPITVKLYAKDRRIVNKWGDTINFFNDYLEFDKSAIKMKKG
jgi:hypothetical protein